MGENKSKYRTITSSIATALTAASLVFAPMGSSVLADSGYTDINEDHSHYEAIMALTESGIVKGYEDGTFRQWKICPVNMRLLCCMKHLIWKNQRISTKS